MNQYIEFIDKYNECKNYKSPINNSKSGYQLFDMRLRPELTINFRQSTHVSASMAALNSLPVLKLTGDLLDEVYKVILKHASGVIAAEVEAEIANINKKKEKLESKIAELETIKTDYGKEE
jgi:hypothetical protein